MRILEISCGYHEDKIGGTETYVYNLCEELILQGHQVFLNYIINHKDKNKPFISTVSHAFKGIETFVIEVNTVDIKTKDLYVKSERYPAILKIFKKYLEDIRPDIIHFHHFSPTDVIAQIEAAKEKKIPIILTYHTPMMTCGHGDMFYLGKYICDGKLIYKRCLACIQTKHGIILPFAYIWASLPDGLAAFIGELVSRKNIKGRMATWLQLPWLTRKRIENWNQGLQQVDHFVAVSEWVYQLLVNNNIPKERIRLSRHAIGQVPQTAVKKNDGILRLGYVGRIHSDKGVDLLLKTFSLIPPDYKLELYVYGFCQDENERTYYEKFIADCSKDKRIKWLGKLREEEKFRALKQLDVLLIPSRWLETGPLVLLEAWAVGVAVIASNIGGSAELVKDSRGGLLFELNDAEGLAKQIMRLLSEPDLLEKLKSSIPAVRTTKQLAEEMAQMYKELCQTKERK